MMMMMRRRITTSTRHRRHSTFGSLFLLLLFLSWNKTTTLFASSSSSASSNRSNRSNGSNILRRFCLHRHRHLYHLFIILLRSNAVKIYVEKTSHTKFWIKKNVTSHLKHILCYTLNNIIISMFAISSSSTIQCQIQANQHACSSRCACAGRRRG